MPKLGLQLYTLRGLLEEDFVGTLHKVAQMGYEGVEFAGYGGLTPVELRRTVSDLGLEPVSSHVNFKELESNLDKVIDDSMELGLSYIVCPSVPQELRRGAEDFQKLAELFNQVGERISRAGLKFAYHNHDWEFQRLNEECVIDSLYKVTDPKHVQAELDIYWIEYAGQSASMYIQKYANRVELLHVKDMTNDDERFFAEVGTGRLDIEGILSVAENSNVQWYIVEQDRSRRNALESVQISYRYLSERHRD